MHWNVNQQELYASRQSFPFYVFLYELMEILLYLLLLPSRECVEIRDLMMIRFRSKLSVWLIHSSSLKSIYIICIAIFVCLRHFPPVWFICRLFTLELHHSSWRVQSRGSARAPIFQFQWRARALVQTAGSPAKKKTKHEKKKQWSIILIAGRADYAAHALPWMGGWGARRTVGLESAFNHFSASLNWLAASSPVSQVREATRRPHQGSNQLNCRMHFGKRYFFSFFPPLFSTGAFKKRARGLTAYANCTEEN